jgi:intracellular sulfur oxidation DsrE/DsrF family protein
MSIRSFLTALTLMLGMGIALAQDKVKVVYHFDNTETQATAGLRTLRNYMDTAPDTKIVVVALGDGVRFLMEDAKDKKNNDLQYGPLISDLVAKGVTFEICELTMRAMDLKKEQFVLDAGFTPSGVVRIGQLQVLEGYGYIKP